MTLTIISHTEHYYRSDGTLVGWGPTVTEINHLLDLFDSICHVAMLHPSKAPPSALPYRSDRITFLALPVIGGKTWSAKMQWVFQAPKVIQIVKQAVQSSDCFQLRTPVGMGIYLIPYLNLFLKVPGWYKYAGNWNQKSAPLGYRFQRFLLRNQRRPVTINGHWSDQPSHCLTFENPCLTQGELEAGDQYTKQRSLPMIWNFCYVGRLEEEKGVGRIIQAISKLSLAEKKKIGQVHFVGDGLERERFEGEAKKSGVAMTFYGYLPREEVFQIYMQSHVFIMPTQASEGFPKVIAEAMNFGCLPVVSDVSSIPQYIRHGREGFLIPEGTAASAHEVLKYIIGLKTEPYMGYLREGRWLVSLFGFKNYLEKLRSEVLPHF